LFRLRGGASLVRHSQEGVPGGNGAKPPRRLCVLILSNSRASLDSGIWDSRIVLSVATLGEPIYVVGVLIYDLPGPLSEE